MFLLTVRFGVTDPTPLPLDVLWSVAFRRCRVAGAPPEDAQDCAQDAIAELLARPDDVDSPKAWVATVACRRYIDLCRLRAKERTAGLAPTPAGRIPDAINPEELAVGRAYARWAVGRMRRWPKPTRAVCATLAAGMSRPEISRRLGLTHRALESHLTRARRLLRALGLLAVAAIALGRALRAAAPAGSPAAAAALPSVAVLFLVGNVIGGLRPDDGSGTPAGATPPAAVHATTPPPSPTGPPRHDPRPAGAPTPATALPAPTPRTVALPRRGPTGRTGAPATRARSDATRNDRARRAPTAANPDPALGRPSRLEPGISPGRTHQESNGSAGRGYPR